MICWRSRMEDNRSPFSHLASEDVFCKGMAVPTKRQIPCRKSSSNKLSVFSALNLPSLVVASTLKKAKNIPSVKLQNSKTKGKKIRAYGTD